MKRSMRRSAFIDARTRSRRIANLRARQAFEHQSEAQRAARLDWLAQLASVVERGGLSREELANAQAALEERNPRQQRLDLGTSRNAPPR